MTIPTIHLNGSGKKSLIEGLSEAYSALNNAQSMLCQAAPHGRDYYTQGDDAIANAMNEHRSRLKKIESIKEELSEIMEGICAQDKR